ncbi:MAG TPA: BatD family protein [Sedimentisphaerales bacterium]|nr:BatD family protein [Sedimentisphaerales bacterium]
MSASVKYVLALCVLASALCGRAAAQVRVFAQVETSKDIYVGERFAYNIIIDGDTSAGRVDVKPLAKYKPQSTGNRPISQTSVNIVNGKMTQTVLKRCVMGFSLVADAPGRIQLPSVTVTFAGKTYRTNPVEVNIIQPGTTERLDIEAALSESRCYVGQPVIITVKFYYSAEISNPQFNIPVLSSDDFYLENPDITNPGEKEYDLGGGTTVFVSQNRTTHKGRDWNLIVLRKVLIPKIPGQMELAPSSVSTDVAVSGSRSFFGPRYQYKRFMVSSQPLTLTVLPLPDEGRPAEFYGLVGRYTISASAAPTKVNVGDPITLSIKIGGSKFLKPVQWPDLEQIPQMSENFKIPSQRSSPTIDDGFKVFTQTIRANNDKVSAVPPIPLAIFDPDKGQYVVAKTEPIPLSVAPTKILTGADLEGSDFAPVNKEVEAIKKGLSANYEGLDVLKNQTFSPLAAAFSPGYAALWGAPLVAFVLSALVKLFTATTPAKVAARRRRSALGRSVRQLKRIPAAERRQRNELLASAMKQYIGERFDRVPGSLTADDCHRLIITGTEDAEAAGSYRSIITDCEAARYASVEANVDGVRVNDVVNLVRKIDKGSRK